MIRIWIDGAARGNPGPSAIAFVVENGHEAAQKLLYEGTNNRAEYLALLSALNYAIAQKLEEVQILSDSALVVNQVNGFWRCRSEHLQPFLRIVQDRILCIPKFTILQIPREENKRADKLCNEALDRGI